MDAAYDAAPALRGPTLMLYGRKDEIIPKEPSFTVMRFLKKNGARIAYYGNGYHMLLRDLEGPIVVKDIAAWIADKQAPLASGAERTAETLLSGVADEP